MQRIKSAVSFLAHSVWQFFRQRRFIRTTWFGPLAAYVFEIERDGFHVIPSYKSAEWCEAARAEIAAAMASEAATRTDEDTRVFGAEKVSAHAREFATDPMLAELATMYAGGEEALLFCMANHLTYREGKYGSGGEWHRDGFRREMKALIYLTDVTLRDGPFGLVKGSQSKFMMLIDSVRIVWRILCGETGITATRLKDTGTRWRAEAFTAPAGTLILFDACAIHTGHRLQPGGERYALTNYYVEPGKASAVMEYYRQHVRVS